MLARVLRKVLTPRLLPLTRKCSDCSEEVPTEDEDDAPKVLDPCLCGCLEKNVSGLAMPLDSVKVAVIGADSEAAQAAALLLKSNPLVSELRLHGDDNDDTLRGAVFDLSQVPTQTVVTAHAGPNQLAHALCQAEIVLVTGTTQEAESDADPIEKNASFIRLVATACINNCPEAILAISVPPINFSLPLFAEIMKQNEVFVASRVLGNAMEHMLAAKSLVASSLGLHPRSVCVDITGGTSPATLIPVVTSAKPGGFFLYKQAPCLAESIRATGPSLKAANGNKDPVIFQGYADAMFVDEIARGLCGKAAGRVVPVLMRTILVPELKYMVLPVHMGLNGVDTIRGIPSMSPTDFDLLQSAVPALVADITAAGEYATRFSTNISAADPRVPDYGADAYVNDT